MNNPINIQSMGMKLRIAKWIGYLSIIDLLIFPYFQTIIFPYSLPLVFFGTLFLSESYNSDRYTRMYSLIVFAVVASFCLSIFITPYSKYIVNNFKYALQLLSTFFYFFYFRMLASNTKLSITPILIFFCIWYIAFGIYFLFLPFQANDLLIAIYGRLVNDEESIMEGFRFSYLFQDPNTAIYFFLLAVSPLLMSSKTIYMSFSVVFAAGLMTFISQSSGGLVAFILMILAWANSSRFRDVISYETLLLISSVVVAIFLLYVYITYIGDDNALVESAGERLFGDSERYLGGSGRFYHWERQYSNFIPLPLGRGYSLAHDGALMPPHSDFLGLLYRYGLLALVPALVFLFGRWRGISIMIVPALIPFAINTLLDEQKLFALFLSLLALEISPVLRGSTASSNSS